MDNKDFYNYIKEKISTSTNKEDDKFVGISYKNDKLIITAPIGYTITIPNDESTKVEFRNKIKLLISIIKKYYSLRDNDDANNNVDNTVVSYGYRDANKNFPIYSYDFLIQDYISKGYYFEKEQIYKETQNGKINWSRTIKNEKSYFDNDNLFFLKFIRRKSNILNNELMTLLHKTCVYESFNKWGFMYFDNNIAEKPRITIEDAKKYIPFIKEKLSKTFNDRNKMLFQHMINVILWNVSFSENEEYKYGVSYFHPVWEKMIDYSFGVEGNKKKKYYPNAMWHLVGKPPSESSDLRPDSIMEDEEKDDLYVLDAKYYGSDNNKNHKLPGTSDINKQITYGKFVEKISKKEPYNAFLIPAFNNEFSGDSSFKYIGYADFDAVIHSTETRYARVATILVKTDELMKLMYENANKTIKQKLMTEIKKAQEKEN